MEAELADMKARVLTSLQNHQSRGGNTPMVVTQLGPQGVHVAYVVIDAAIDMPFARRRREEKPEDYFAKPADLASEIYHTAHQPKSARSFYVELRPFGETW